MPARAHNWAASASSSSSSARVNCSVRATLPSTTTLRCTALSGTHVRCSCGQTAGKKDQTGASGASRHPCAMSACTSGNSSTMEFVGRDPSGAKLDGGSFVQSLICRTDLLQTHGLSCGSGGYPDIRPANPAISQHCVQGGLCLSQAYPAGDRGSRRRPSPTASAAGSSAARTTFVSA